MNWIVKIVVGAVVAVAVATGVSMAMRRRQLALAEDEGTASGPGGTWTWEAYEDDDGAWMAMMTSPDDVVTTWGPFSEMADAAAAARSAAADAATIVAEVMRAQTMQQSSDPEVGRTDPSPAMQLFAQAGG